VGLGVGTIAAYGIPGDHMRFYEINPEVIRIASFDPQRLFTFLSDSRAEVKVVPGDARISLQQELNRNEVQNFDVLVIDAFSGDAIPVHLLTEEAFQLYLRHLSKPNGILAVHISNKALDLRPVIARLAAESNMSAWLAQSGPGTSGNAYRSMWVIAAELNRDGPVPGAEHMTRITPSEHFPLWTDDYSNLIRVIRW
jgi:spermidine synthase